ncbi:MAG TPA: FAD-binding oxidoreductase, partial [Acidimicrobiaceae bacterium]|nr:FAD-binding oxidoreductase [Acidimicrobiaceae bacterium]
AVGPPDPTDALAAALDAHPGVLDVAVATDAARAAALWHVREVHTEAIAHLGVPRKYDVTVPSPRLARFVEQVPDLIRAVDPDARVWIFGHLGDGNLHVNVTSTPAPSGTGPLRSGTAGVAPDAVADTVLGRVVTDGGSVSAEHGIGKAKRAWLLRDRAAGDVAGMRAIKAALDPDGILNPNVLL